jgi:integrase
MATKPLKPTPDFPLFPHSSGVWAKKIGGKLRYFGPWDDPQAALDRYNAWLAGAPTAARIVSCGRKVSKPKDFPLYLHRSGQWAKKIRGRVRYFGADQDAALEKWCKQKDDLLAGREPEDGSGLTVGRLANLFLESKQLLVNSGEINQRTWNEYKAITDRVVPVLGPGRLVANLRPADFERLRSGFAKTHGAVSLHNDITRARVLFNYAFERGLIEVPVKYGDGFDKPSRTVLRRARQARPPRMFEASEIRQLQSKASTQLKAMILLGINCGLGNTDCAMLPATALDLKHGWLDFPRPKTGIGRRCPLWPETVAALRMVLETRREPKDPAHKDRVFITRCRVPWESKSKSKTDNPVSKETRKVLNDVGIRRLGLGFYALRHTFQTIGEEARDKDAVRSIMGHAEASNDMSAVYNEKPVDDARLLAVTNHVHNWLFPPETK